MLANLKKKKIYIIIIIEINFNPLDDFLSLWMQSEKLNMPASTIMKIKHLLYMILFGTFIYNLYFKYSRNQQLCTRLVINNTATFCSIVVLE